MELGPIFEMGLKVIKFEKNAKNKAHGFFQKQKLVKTMESWDPFPCVIKVLDIWWLTKNNFMTNKK